MEKIWSILTGAVVLCVGSMWIFGTWSLNGYQPGVTRCPLELVGDESTGCYGSSLASFEGLSYGPQGYMNWDSVVVGELSTLPIFGEKPRLLRGRGCDSHEVDPVGASCTWGLAVPPHFNPSILPIPDSSPLRKVGKYIGIARPPSTKLPQELGVPNLPRWRRGEGFIQEEDGPLPPTVMIYGENMRVKAVAKLFDKVHPGQQSDSRLLRFGSEWWVHFRADCLIRGVNASSPPVGVECDRTNGWVGEHRKQRAVLMRLVPEVWVMQGKMGLMIRADPATLLPLIGPLSGKNQAFFQVGEGSTARQFVLAWLNPTTVHEIRGGAIDSKPLPGSGISHPHMPSLEFVHLNGGQLVYLPESEEFLGIGHHIYRKPDGYRLYNIHLFYTLSTKPPYPLSRISPEFCFESTSKKGDCEKRQFAMGMIVEKREGGRKTQLLIPYGVNNYEAKLFIMPLREALALLRPVSELR
ncbi:unnamed protein product [Discosporangium mesarthrocarpum]